MFLFLSEIVSYYGNVCDIITWGTSTEGTKVTRLWNIISKQGFELSWFWNQRNLLYFSSDMVFGWHNPFYTTFTTRLYFRYISQHFHTKLKMAHFKWPMLNGSYLGCLRLISKIDHPTLYSIYHVQNSTFTANTLTLFLP